MGKLEAIKNKYRDEGLWSAAKEVPVQGWDLVKEHKGKTIGISLAVIAVASLTAAYFLSPAYATFVGTVGTKAATLVSPAITAMSAFAVAHPLIASLVVLAAVAALITAPVYAYKNSGKSEEIKALNSNINEIAAKVNKDNTDPKTMIDELKVMPCLANTRPV
ncbi:MULTISPECIES: hypothetical protein [unclassified Wolbachia]|uniref:hypothetical protein n=1 Tax=unclassified Wolbachia TaxID=2640676 RepID=UPI001FE6ACC4|nr:MULTISPECIES: hypothetical protein [unclassified Wolbachia]UXX40246.1 hypothetical protein MJ631_07135 [Wolbachia endosymbiont of Oryzaephilus surinamensis]